MRGGGTRRRNRFGSVEVRSAWALVVGLAVAAAMVVVVVVATTAAVLRLG